MDKQSKRSQFYLGLAADTAADVFKKIYTFLKIIHLGAVSKLLRNSKMALKV